jgi:hypothetical protein
VFDKLLKDMGAILRVLETSPKESTTLRAFPENDITVDWQFQVVYFTQAKWSRHAPISRTSKIHSTSAKVL